MDLSPADSRAALSEHGPHFLGRVSPGARFLAPVYTARIAAWTRFSLRILKTLLTCGVGSSSFGRILFWFPGLHLARCFLWEALLPVS